MAKYEDTSFDPSAPVGHAIVHNPTSAHFFHQPETGHDQERRIAAALGGDGAALAALAEADAQGALARRHRVGAALYLRAAERGLRTPAVAGWHRDLVAGAAHHLRLRAALERVAAVLAAAGVGWVPFKGYDLATRVYAHPEERPTADLDLLIAARDLARAREALTAAGWRGRGTGPRWQRYLAEEGYAWQATEAGGLLLELHFRLWGSVDPDLQPALVTAAIPDPELGAGGRRLTLPHAFLAAAVHAWLAPPPRPVGGWWDLERISATASAELVDEVTLAARRWDVQLPVALAAEVAAGLWSEGKCRRIAAALSRDLRPPERLAATWARRRGLTGVGVTTLHAARLVAGRRSRRRLRAVWRRFWPHPGGVEMVTPETWPWAARRLWLELGTLRLRPSAAWLERRLAMRYGARKDNV